MSQALLAIWNILQHSNIFNRSRETVLVMPFGDENLTQFSGFLPTSVSYLKATCCLAFVFYKWTLRKQTRFASSCQFLLLLWIYFELLIGLSFCLEIKIVQIFSRLCFTLVFFSAILFGYVHEEFSVVAFSNCRLLFVSCNDKNLN